MSASYPASVEPFTPKADGPGNTVLADHINALQDAIAAIETALLTGGLEHNLFPESSADARTLGTSSKFWGLAYLKAITLAAAGTLTIASGIVTASQGFHAVDTEGAAGTDDLDTITAGAGLVEGTIVILRAANVAHVVTAKDGTGNLLLNGDYALSATDRTLTLIYDGTNFRELARSGGFVSSGTFAPTIGGSGGQSGQVYAVQVGKYVKVDKLVTAYGRIQLSTLGTITTDVQLQGLPFTSENTSNLRFTGVIGEWESMTSSFVSLGLDGVPNVTAMTLYGRKSAGTGAIALAQADLSANTAFSFSVAYAATT